VGGVVVRGGEAAEVGGFGERNWWFGGHGG
jgi:hypothetical protein